MSGTEVAAAVALGTELVDAKYHLKEDLFLIQKVIRSATYYAYNVYRKKASYWYFFENTVRKYPNNAAVAFARPKGGHKEVKLDLEGNKVYDDNYTVEQYSYKELYDMILRLSYIMRYEYGITSKDTIALDCMNKPLFILVWFALWNIGAVPAFLNFNTKDLPLIHCLKIVNASQVFVDPDCSEPIRKSEEQLNAQLPNVKLHYLNEEELLRTLLDSSRPKYRAPDETRRPDDIDSSCSLLIYTSGTTGLPKSAIMSWRKAYMASSFFGYIMKIDKKSVVLCAMPLYHSTASMLGVLPALLSGGCICLVQKFSATSFWKQARLCGATHIQYVGEICRYLLQSKPHPDNKRHQVKIAYGNGLRPDIWEQFKSRFGIEGIGEFYAASESPIATTNLQYGSYGIGACRKYGSLINFLLSFQQAIIKMSPDDDSEIYRDPKTGLCVPVGPNEPGELLMKILNPKNVEGSFQGYYSNKQATEKKVLRDVFKKGDAWFRSGDLLKIDKDGLFYFVDRLGDTFRWKSENVSASEVENELMGSGVLRQCVVVGVKVPKHEGRAGFAVIDPAEEFLPKEEHEKLLAKLAQHVKDTLPFYAAPQFVKITRAIEAQHNHKVPKNQFKNQKLPKGEDGKDRIYWLNNGRYEELTINAWDKLMAGKYKL